MSGGRSCIKCCKNYGWCSVRGSGSPDMRSILPSRSQTLLKPVLLVNFVNVHNRYWVKYPFCTDFMKMGTLLKFPLNFSAEIWADAVLLLHWKKKSACVKSLPILCCLPQKNFMCLFLLNQSDIQFLFEKNI